MSKVFVSVVIPVYREKDLLHETIKSCLSQTFKEKYEILLVDNNCDEESRSVLMEYQHNHPEIVRVLKETRQGAPSARNAGILESRSDYIAMMEGDDIMYPDRLEIQYGYFKRVEQDISLLSSYYDLIDWGNRSVIGQVKKDRPFWMEALKIKDMYRSHPSTWFFKKQNAQKVGFFNEAFNPRLVEDDEFNFKMFFTGRFECIEKSLVRVRLPSKSYNSTKMEQVSSSDILQKLDLFFNILKKKLNDEKGKVTFEPQGFRKIRSQWLREMGVGFMRNRTGMTVARHFLKNAIQEDVWDLKNWKWLFRSYFTKKNSLENRIIDEKELSYLLTHKFF